MHKGSISMFFSVLITITLAKTAFCNDPCHEGWIYEDNACIKVYTIEKSYSEARAVCHAENGDLVQIKDGERNEIVSRLVTSVAWIGVQDDDNDGQFSNIDGSGLGSYRPWALGEPNNVGGNERCVLLYGASNDKAMEWNDVDCSVYLPFVCSIEVCPKTWVYHAGDNTCVKSYFTQKTFFEARRACQSENGDLVKIKDEEKKQFVLSLDLGRWNWIGVWDEHWDGRFAYVDGSDLGDFQPWSSGEPNNDGGIEHCGVMYDRYQSGSWNDAYCFSAVSYICEKRSGFVGCQEGWSLFKPDNICIKIFDNSETYSKAEEICQASNAHLMQITSDAQTHYILELKPLSRYWIGVWDKDEDMVYEYIDGSPLRDYKPWVQGEPNNWAGVEHCGELYGSGSGKGKWNDASCSRSFPFICSKSADDST